MAVAENPKTIGEKVVTSKVNPVTGRIESSLGVPFCGEDSIMGIGDSITANGNTPPTSSKDYVIGGQSYLFWACMLSLGRLNFGGVAATGGYNTQQIIDTHLPTIISAKPRFCVVHAGTNDYGTLTLVQTQANLLHIYVTLLNAGIIPIATTLLPKQTLVGSSAYIIQRLNLWIAKISRILAIPCVDWNILMSNTTDGNWVGYSGAGGTYQSDSTHPNEFGARTMGQAIVDALNAYGMMQRYNYLPRVNQNTNLTGFAPTASNALLITDTNADGVADGLNKSGTGTCTTSSMAENEGLGSWQNMTATSSSALQVFGNNGAIVAGNRMLFACRFKTSGVLASGGKFDIRFTDSNTVDIFALRDFKQDVPNGVIYREFVVPAGVGQLFARPFFSVQGTGANLSVGQVAVIDLTAAGLA